MTSSSLALASIDLAVVDVSAKTIWLFLHVRTQDGAEGFGEATLFGAEEAVAAEVAKARALLLQRPLPLPGGALQALAMAQASSARRAVTHALEQALVDLFARRAGLSVAHYLGGPYRDRLAAYANINRGISDRTPAGFAERARWVVETLGYDGVKIAPFDGLNWQGDLAQRRRALAAGIDRIVAVRDAIGRERRLMVDCHWRLSRLDAIEVLRLTESANLFWLEDALDDRAFSAEDFRSVRSTANGIGVRIAGGERAETVADIHDIAAAGGMDVVLPDLRVTGIRNGMVMLQCAVAAGMEASIHNPTGPVLDAISVQVAAALPSFAILEGQVGETALFDEIAGGRPTLIDGRRPVPDGPGTGLAPKLSFDAALPKAGSGIATFAGVAGAGADA